MDIEQKETVTCGFIGSNLLFCLLTDNGYGDLAYKLMVSQNDVVGNCLSFMRRNNLTTFPESTYAETSSNNHGFFASGYLKCMGASLCGIRFENAGGSRIQIKIKPFFVDGIEYADFSTEIPSGKLISRWKKENGRICFDIIVPDR